MDRVVTNRLPLHALHAAAGASFGAPCGLELPLNYGDPQAEYAAVRHAVGLIDEADSGIVEVTGRDRATFLHAMLSNDIKSLTPGQGRAAAFLDVHGKVQVLLIVWALEDRILLVTPHGTAATTIEALDRYLFSERVELRDATGELTLLRLAGPAAPALMQRLSGVDVPAEAWAHTTVRLNGIELRLVRGGAESGEAEVWVVGPADAGAALWPALLAAGARPVGLTARESLRLEAGTPRFGHDVDHTVLLPEIPVEHLVSYTKGCYLGQEVVVRIRDRGHVNRHFRGVLLEGDAVPAPGDVIVAGDREAGAVTSAAWSLGLKRPLALGFIRRQHAEPGTAVTVRTEAGDRQATVTTLPVPR
jgi:folate-binding protein YgfZ